MLAQSRIIAKGNRIRDVRRLVETYGGTPSKWVKKSSPPFEDGGQLTIGMNILVSVGLNSSRSK
jgi:hypothetical protein